MSYYCKNCKNVIGKYLRFNSLFLLCNCIKSKNFNLIYFMHCNKCEKFVGILCDNVCKNCFGENQIFGEKNLFNFFLKYKEIIKKYSKFDYFCTICNNNDFRYQHWFFEELTFYK